VFEVNMENGSTIQSLFEPKSIAVVGASHQPGKIGYLVVDNILKGGYKGKIFPINPKGGEILGIEMKKSLGDVDQEIDVAVITIPAKLVFESVKECAERNVKHLVIITSGFSEVGNSVEEKKIVEYARSHGMRVLGPNIFGIYSRSASLNATFGPSDIRPGNVAIITQSGAIGIAMIGKTKAENIGLSAIVSVGNKADISEIELLNYLVEQDETKIIMMYIEGLHGGEALVEAFRRAAKAKPVVVIKSGRSKRGAMAAASHTGSLAGADNVFDDVAKQCGIIRAESIQEALEWCKYLSNTTVPKGENTVIITNGGGIGVMAADACEKYGVNLYDNPNELKEDFADVMPDFGSAKNPVDLTGQASADDYCESLRVAANNSKIDSVICLGCETASFNASNFADAIKKSYQDYEGKKPIVYSVFGGKEIEDSVNELRREDIPVYPDVYDAVSCLGSAYSHFRNEKFVTESPPPVEVDIQAIQDVIQGVRKEKRTFLLAGEAHKVMETVGLPVPKSRVARTIDETVRFAEEIGYPVVMKVVSKDIVHKSDAGGVALNLENSDEVLQAYESIMHSCRAYKKDAKITGMEIAEMIQPGVETIVGARQDPSFGPVVMFGLGGIYVEVMKDVAFRAFPMGYPEAMKMISEIRSYPLLLGVRGEEKKDIDAAADAIMKVGTIIRGCPDISDIEINPLVVYENGEGAKAVDVRILLSKEECHPPA